MHVLISFVLHCKRLSDYEPLCCGINLLFLFFKTCFDKKYQQFHLFDHNNCEFTQNISKGFPQFFLWETFKMSEAKRIKLSANFNNLPAEMVEKILKILPFKEICQARRICKRWKEIIDKGNLVKDAAGNILSLPFRYFWIMKFDVQWFNSNSSLATLWWSFVESFLIHF